MSLNLLAPLTMAAIAFMSSMTGRPSQPEPRPPVRIVDVRGAAALIARGAAVIDARDPSAFAQGHLPGAQRYAWQSMTGPGSSRGRVKSDVGELARALSAMGVDGARPTLVYGASASGWGEEGHAAWLLCLLGHSDVAMLDGGFTAWRAAGRPVSASTAAARSGVFEPKLQPQWRAARDDIRPGVQLVDVRSAVEFSGATPFGELRGGHAPGAKNLDWRALLDEGGRARPGTRIVRALADAGVDPAKELIVCCSTGVRSAFVSMVLAARGIAVVRNYDGSMVEWAADPSAPLVSSKK